MRDLLRYCKTQRWLFIVKVHRKGVGEGGKVGTEVHVHKKRSFYTTLKLGRKLWR